MMNKFYTIYIGFSRPWTRRKDNRFDMLNECFTMMAGYHLIVYSDMVYNPEVEYNVGFSMCGVIMMCAAMHLSSIIYTAVMMIIWNCNKKRQIRAYHNRRKKLHKLTQDKTGMINYKGNLVMQSFMDDFESFKFVSA